MHCLLRADTQRCIIFFISIASVALDLARGIKIHKVILAILHRPRHARRLLVLAQVLSSPVARTFHANAGEASGQAGLSAQLCSREWRRISAISRSRRCGFHLR